MTVKKEDIQNALNRKEIFRYLGYGAKEPDTMTQTIIDEVLSKLLHEITPKSIYRLCNCRIENDSVFIGELEIKSRNLAGNLAQCSTAALFAATLGVEADKLLQRCEVINMAWASMAQACGAACIEAYCNLVQEEIRLDAQKKSGVPLFIRPRFSPGYGDLPIETQIDIFRALDCTKRIGLTLTQSLLMYPTKSVTAFIGFTSNPDHCHIEKCQNCGKTDCEYRV